MELSRRRSGLGGVSHLVIRLGRLMFVECALGRHRDLQGTSIVYAARMIRISALVSLASLAACGGNKTPVEEPPPVVETRPEEPPLPPTSPTPESPVSANLGAKAALQPVKGAKQPPGTVTLTQANDVTSVVSDFEGLRPGRYHLVVHDGTECGDNATKAGDPWKGAESVKLSFVVGGDEPGNVDESGVALKLDGVAPVIGQTLALHEDKKGQPGKILACGTIDLVGAAP
jgi:predicted small lipoprotein YifL